MPPKKRNLDGGTGYGGHQDDTKRLTNGLRKAEKNWLKEDENNANFLKKAMIDIQDKLLCAEDWESIDVLVSEQKRDRIVSILAHVFRNQVPTDWHKRKELYLAALNICRTLSSDFRLGTLFGQQDDQEKILFWLLDFSKQAEEILKREAGDCKLLIDPSSREDMLLATHVSEVAHLALRSSSRSHAGQKEAELSIITKSERYLEALGPLRFDTVEEMPNHHFLKNSQAAPSTTNARLLFKELTAYRNALPVEYGSSCFCRVIDSRLDLLRVMITGPDDTPYANGCFFFDIILPSSYPQIAPKIQYLTTGGGRMRLNPNLYQCGKVCLSLLGTWKGPGWISGQSTLLQVIVSIQSLILVPDPYFNEPGWERERGTARGKTNSYLYNNKIRRYTITAAINAHLTSILAKNNPYPEFESPMIEHFLKKRDLIEGDLKSWVKDDPSLSAKAGNISELLSRLETRERESRKAAARSKRATKSIAATIYACAQSNTDEHIILDDTDDEVQCKSTDVAKPEGKKKSAEENCNNGSSKKSAAPSNANNVVDLTI
mmetsp:Transcript_25288/g.50445  ORF Transcript_25288/g.50445 Transcript_25288/m.50445 type:complete len:547 (-) Transcript_25288:2170-3810(-)